VREPWPIRGGECYIAASEDGEQFTDIWRAEKGELNSSSVEKSSLIKTLEGEYRLYISYVDSVDHRWRIDMIEAPHSADFSITKRKRILTASSAQCEGVGVMPGDEVIVPAYGWDSNATAVLTINAVPIFVDIEPETFCIDPDKIEEAVTDKTRAIIAIHLAGCVADMDRIMGIDKKCNLYVVEDCCRSHGSMWRGKNVGSIGDINFFSFQQNKVMTSGEGGNNYYEQ